MRAYAMVQDGTALVHIPATSNRVALTKKTVTDKPDGWYRASATFTAFGMGGWWNLSVGARVDPAKEAKRLRGMAARVRDRSAHTSSPGIKGYQEREAASTGAIRIQEQISTYFAAMLEEVAEGRKLMLFIDCNHPGVTYRGSEDHKEGLRLNGGCPVVVQESPTEDGAQWPVKDAPEHWASEYREECC